ncbi:MAG: aminoglycoside phosphotransferase family protein [Anaerohalosphaeraceae bacterium]|nr:aminoglycoside phosphotransferase family protein [Anaerohalosphaeraceae bacterium]
MEFDLKKVFDNFQIEGQFLQAAPYGSGHINDTFAVEATDKRYIFQRINRDVFKNPPKLMDNIARVTRHIHSKLESQGAEDIDRRVLTVIPAGDGKDYHIDADGNYWRAYIFVEKARTYDVMENLAQAYEAAKAFGNFQNMLVDLPGPALFETIPDFHNGSKRFQAFENALKADVCNRAKDAKDEIAFLQASGWIFDIFPKLVEQGGVPIRITHNDTKINNVMIDDKTNEGICVIDLDTVMPGLALYDFGDIMRTTLSPSAEDEQDLSKVFMEMPRFEAVLKGYLSTAGRFLNKAEKEHLAFSGKMITLTIGTRFLTDYLAGDTYFKVHRDGHNLDRCRTQFKLVQSITENQEQILKLVEKYGS